MPRRLVPKIFTQTLVPKGKGCPIKISYLYFVTFFIVVPILCIRLKHSLWNKLSPSYKDKAELLKENNLRLSAANTYISSLQAGRKHDIFPSMISQRTENDIRVDIQIVITTLSRNRIAKALDNYEPKYLTQALWRFSTLALEAHSGGFPYSLRISACNVDADPMSYDEAKHISKFIDVYQRFNKTYTEKKHPKEKEKEDYIYCINELLKERSKYMLVVEDDGYPTNDFFLVLRRTMDRYLERRYRRGELVPQTDQVAFVKFYHAEWVMGFVSLQRERLPELLAMGMLFGTLLTLLLERYYFIMDKHAVRLWLLMMLYAMLVSFFVGRVNLMEFHRLLSPHLYSYVPAPACCIPGVLYTAEGARRLAGYLQQVTCSDDLPKDMAIGAFVRDTGVTTYQVQPNTFLHIGAYSLVREKFDPTRVD